MKYLIRNNLAYVIALGAVFATAGTIAMAQSYTWIPLGSIASSWNANGAHIYNSNAGSVVVGGISPSGSLLLDVAGEVGGSAYCDENGLNCFQARDVQWRLSGSNQYSNNSGNVGIGTSNPTEKLHVNGNVLASAYYYSSDERLKHNIISVAGMDVVDQLEGVSFAWNDTGERSIGLIAQNVEEVLPVLVRTDPVSGYKSVEYASVIAPLVEAVKEQQREIDELREVLEKLKQQ